MSNCTSHQGCGLGPAMILVLFILLIIILGGII